MNRKLLKSFFKDFLVDTIAFFSANLLIGLFYYIDTGKKIEILYPLSLVLFVYFIWMGIRFFQYYKIYHGIENMVKHHDCHEDYPTELGKRTEEAVRKLHADYLDRLSESENTRKKDRRFLSLWIHNMKTPVTVTDLLLQRLERKEMNTIDGIQALNEENNKLLTSLDHVLNMIRLEDFAKDYVPDAIDLLEELKSIINKNKSLFIYSRVFPKIITDLPEAVILSDRKWNELMIHQLISNGVKYSKEEGISKNIYFIVKKEKDQINLTIQDEGIGIPEHDLSKVCEPFFTGDNGRKGYQSSGIGLYFCNEVCKLLGHTLKITSEIGKGTSVEISYLAKL
jgi:signal transduction histidine kinase